MKKRILSFMTLLCMVTTLLPANITAFASTVDSGTCGDNLTWNLDSSGTLTISGTGKMTDWSSGSYVPWYSSRNSIKTIVIGGNVTSIGNYAFDSYSNLTSVTIGNSVTSIGGFAFCNCSSLTSVTIPGSVTFINMGAFGGCTKLTNVTILDGVTGLGYQAFAYCPNLTSIAIPGSVTHITDCAFENCKNLTSIIIPDSVTQLGGCAFSGCTNLINVKIGSGVYRIQSDTFAKCTRLTNITIDSGVKKIENSAFSYCYNLTNVYYNGTETEWNNISVKSYNEYLTNATRTYFAYINIFDKDANKVVDTTQKMDETLDISKIDVPENNILKLYKNKELTEEYSLDTPISENLNLYYDIIEVNKLKITGAESAVIGQKGIAESVTFATDKTAKDFVAIVKYSDKLNLSEVKAKDFTITEQSSETNGGYTYLYLTCTYKNDGNMPKNTTLNPFDLVFDVSESATTNEKLTIEFVNDETFLADSGANTYDFEGLGKAEIKVNPIFVSGITINGADEIDKATQYTAVILPENATNKDIEWTVDNSDIATISVDGILTPVKAGTVKIKATAKGGNDVYAEKLVNVKVYATITTLTASVGEWDKTFTPSEREYTIYVPKNTASIKLKPQYNGTLKLGTQTLYNNRNNNNITLSNLETVLTLNYSETGYTNSTYTIKIVKFEGTQTTVSEDGKVFTVKPINIEKGNTVILGLYKGDTFVGMEEPKVYNGEDVIFTTTKDYTNAKVMVWDSLGGMIPICEAEEVE